jgi:hypothetical protein
MLAITAAATSTIATNSEDASTGDLPDVKQLLR